MKRLIIFLLLTTFCATSMAGVSTDSVENWYEDLLELLDLYRDRDEILEKVDAYNEFIESSEAAEDAAQSYGASVNTDTETFIDDLPLLAATDDSGGLTNPVQVSIDGSDSPVISNPEPCSIILSSIGLGIVGYLKRRRAI